MKYFLHDTNSFQDEKITELFIAHGYEGLGLFYTILEKLAMQEKPVKTAVLKKQLSVGKKLEKVWSFLEEIELVYSNNGETFNENILKFSEKYQIKKDKTKERVSKWRENQEVTENVTRYESVCNTPKVKESKVKEIEEKESKEKASNPSGAAEAAAPSVLKRSPAFGFNPESLPAEQKPPVADTPQKSKPATLEDRREAFKEQLRDHYRADTAKYPADMYPEFINYWAESDGKKMRWEKEKAFEIPNRLATWHRRNLEKPSGINPQKHAINGSTTNLRRDSRNEPIPGTPFGKL